MKRFLWYLAIRFLAPASHRAILVAVTKAHLALPEEPYTANETRDWGKLLTTEFGRKLDLTMCNWCTQRAWMATQAPASEIEKMTGFALGARAAWETAKSISRLGEANSPISESDAQTVAADLEHLRP